MEKDITVRDTEADETFSALLFLGGSNKFTHRGKEFARVCEIGSDGDARSGWVEITEVDL